MNEDKKKILKAERIIVLQAIVDAYLNKNGKKPAREEFPFEKDEYGKLNTSQYKMLHFYLAEEFKALGLDLSEAIKAAGETETPGTLTNFELKELSRRADEILLIIAAIQDRKQALLTK
ncbi:MAG: hypothetical protein ACI31S_03305 [Bacilli bacterium]